MGKKYLLEIEENKDGSFAWSNFAPYAEPDLEQVRKEAYEQGRKVGIKDGMCEAWETAKKVTYASKYGGYGDCLDKVFDRHDGDAWDVFDYSPTEAIEKIRQYEKEREEQIQVGDEVISPNGKGVVTEIIDIYVRIMYAKGSGQVVKPEDLTKTGRHFPEIVEVLQKMKE